MSSSFRKGSPFRMGSGGGRPRGRRGNLKARLLIAAAIALFAVCSHFSTSSTNPITGQRERGVSLTPDQEIEMGLQAVDQMARQHQGFERSAAAERVQQMGYRLVAALDDELAGNGRENPYEFQFHLLKDRQLVNAFALPGGQVFVTRALYRRLTTEGQLAGVLGHEIGHVLSRHGAKRVGKSRLLQGLAQAAGVAGGDVSTARMAQQAAQLISMKYGRQDEHESDAWGVRLMAAAGYDPRAMVGVMKILAESTGEGPPEFLSTHPKPANRVQYIQQIIAEQFPQGLPPNLRR